MDRILESELKNTELELNKELDYYLDLQYTIADILNKDYNYQYLLLAINDYEKSKRKYRMKWIGLASAIGVFLGMLGTVVPYKFDIQLFNDDERIKELITWMLIFGIPLGIGFKSILKMEDTNNNILPNYIFKNSKENLTLAKQEAQTEVEDTITILGESDYEGIVSYIQNKIDEINCILFNIQALKAYITKHYQTIDFVPKLENEQDFFAEKLDKVLSIRQV